ncbi:MAG: ubiquinone/menaquinone biosynthesis methyltransferase [Candidatus Hodarchaeota archaeon]
MNPNVPEIEDIFNRLTSRYRLGNLLISGGTIAYTRRQAIRALSELSVSDWVLDVACGPGDLGRSIPQVQDPKRGFHVVGLDVSSNMLRIALKKNSQEKNKLKRLHLIRANALRLPFPDSIFKAILIGYGLRNLTPRKQALAEFFRVTKEKGVLICLETSQAVTNISHFFQTIHFRYIVPIIGKLLKREREYGHLNQSIAHFPTAYEIQQEMEEVGWAKIQKWPLLGGAVMIHIGLRVKEAKKSENAKKSF